MCWLNLHWWRRLPDKIGEWGIRTCRVCHRREKAMYDAIVGMYWVSL